jgi:hypothetical protein
VRKLVALALAGAALWLAPGALAAGWCGTGEAATDRPDITTGQQIHAVVVIPSDAPDNFVTDANRLADDVASMTAWWTGQDPTRAPRFDQAAFSSGSCLDISFVRLPESSASLRGAGLAFDRVMRDLDRAGFSSVYKKYYVYYDGPSVQTNVCGTGGGDFATGPAYAVVWLGGCPSAPTDAIGAHELVHALGALPAGAPHACPDDPGHPCDAPLVDLLSEYTDGRPLQQQVLDVGRDDYYGHGGSWDDLQDSVWLSHRDTPQVPLSVAMIGAGSVSSDLPGLTCNAACTTQWDQGSTVSLTATPGVGMRLVRWTGGCAGNVTCTVTLAQAQSVTAVFAPRTIPLKVTTKGRGSVRCTPVCSKAFLAGVPLTLRAVPAKGWKFAGWSGGGCRGTRPVCRPATGAALTVRATFRRK